MMLQKWHADLIKKYSFIDDARLHKAKLEIFYTAKGKEKKKTLPIRASIAQLQQLLRRIEKDTGVSKYGKGLNEYIYTS